MSSKDTKKVVANKIAPKTAVKPAGKVAPVAKTPAKSQPARPVAKPVAKALPVKTEVKTVAKSIAKPVIAKPVITKVAPSAKAASKVMAKPAAKPAAKLVAKVSPKPAKIEPKAVVKAELKPTPKPEVPAPIAKVEPSKEIKIADGSVLLKTFKLVRTPFFFEVIEAEERNNKKKYSSDAKLPEKPTICVRNRSSLVEETPEELIERLAQELEEENFGMMREFGQQLCTKCGVSTVTMEFRVDKDLGYCEECADILRLGQSKEARKSEYQLSLSKRDPLAVDNENTEGGTVDDDELEELEGDEP